ncbi:MAG: phosphatidylglycerol lysyltransferase domain-containing protein [Actinomycetes bacterium]|jgi:lysyl-tRNA synthetase class 2
MKTFRQVPLWIGRLTLLLGILNVAANVFRNFQPLANRISGYTPLLINSTAFSTALFTSLMLILVARGLSRRKRRAWNLSIIILVINIVAELSREITHPAQLVVNSGLVLLLVVFRKEFYAISDPTTKRQPFIAFFLILLLIIISGILFIYFRHRTQIQGNFGFTDVLQQVLEGLVGITGPIKFTSNTVSDTVGYTLGALGIFSIILPLWLFFRRSTSLPTMSAEDLEHVKILIRHDQDQDSLGYFATRKDKSVVWTENRKAGIAYRVQNGVMLASGDPFGEFSLWPDAITEFLKIAQQHAWTPGVMGCSDRGGEVWVEKSGMIAIDIGDEAIIKVADFTLDGRPMANVRQMVNRIARKGYITTTTQWSDLDSETKKKLRKLANEWRYGVAERGFSMSMDRFGEEADSNTYITIAFLEGEIKGLLYFVPWATNSLSLDRMQRERGTDAGVNELMITDTVAWGRANGITHISLNFAAFRSLFERADKISAGPITRGMRNLIRFLSGFFQVESLYRFNAKFQPEWETRYVLYPRATDLPKVAWAALKAEKFVSGFRKN